MLVLLILSSFFSDSTLIKKVYEYTQLTRSCKSFFCSISFSISSCNRGVDGNFKGRRSCTNHPRSNPSSPRFSTRSSRNNSNYSKSFSADNLHRVSTSSNASMDSACENDDDVSPTAESEKERKEKEKVALQQHTTVFFTFIY